MLGDDVEGQDHAHDGAEEAQQRGDVGDRGQHGEVLLEVGDLVDRRVLHRLLDLLARLAVLEQGGLGDRGHRAAVLLADLDGALDVALQQRRAHLGDELVDVHLDPAEDDQLVDDGGQREERQHGDPVHHRSSVDVVFEKISGEIH